MENGKIDYPVSTGYRKEWGDWEAIREIMQNAFDSDEQVQMDYEDGVLTIRDRGEGFSLRHLLIGESEKDGVETIGKFGEGLKFALLTLLRQDRETLIRSNGLTLKPELIEMFGVKTMRINYETAPRPLQGTKVVVAGLKESFRDRFLSLDKGENFVSRPLLNRPGKLYIKGIYVSEIKSIAGYNLKIERENPLSGSVDSWKVQNGIEGIITSTNNREYIEKLLQVVASDPKRICEEFSCGSWHSTWIKSHPKVWSDAVEKIFGKKVCLSTSPPLSREAEYRGFKVLYCAAYFLKGTMNTDMEVILSDNRPDFIEHEFESLSDIEKDNLRKVCWLIFETYYVTPHLLIGTFTENPNTLGISLYNRYIKIAYKILKDFDSLYETLIHEFVHYHYGHADLTPEFQDSLGIAHARIVKYLNGDRILVPAEFLTFGIGG